ncbi:LOW QUALITY PROTEIN: protein xmas-2-like [Rhagoletis pomonella]|uniref:LOW QUALITY PROTEIN: protein xmas-2-like n=1 Tax=Rhagoletis pomonella TaxID=28610 RepID=UPI0017807AF7|nr:LOW QUALITY PROTEIN: protein xmas-2-like [Rhagoletis pomonella]
MLGDAEAGWDDGINYKAISCEKIPDLFLDKLVAKNHFSKFGKITRFILRPSRQSCTVEYETEAQAERALDQAGYYNGIEFQIEYATREVAHVQNTEEWVNPEVQAELDAMGLRQTLPIYRVPTTAMFSASKAASLRTQKFPLPATKPGKSDTPTEVAKIDISLRQEYEAIMRRPAYTDEEKYRVLDARDKLMRLIRPRQTDIKKVERTKGICPDMCPEKERLMREFQRQVSTFEMCSEEEDSRSSISHKRAIKEYSRSSADQEVPLAHELRPENVLQMTMLYLMHRIMDLCDDPQTSIADWFHFVWDRTRSIRKDITQQELCSLGTVQLAEQCARFHIHCAARLVAEDPSVFDKKINAENLTKCLQSLKYMYHDLRIKGVHCPCEAEFRSYIVLLNLGDSNFLWELKQLPTHVQHSKEIKQAIAFYNAIQNNNYVRFFSMIRGSETSYLSACILLGYFNKLRWRAMEAINKSHNWRKNAVLIPLAYLTKILGFEDEDSAEQYFTYHGLKCNGDSLLLDRLKRPDIDYSMERALNLVESKRTVSVGECVCGHTLESADIFENNVPHNSFDENGILKTIAWTADDQLRGEAAEQWKRQRELEMQQRLQQDEAAKTQKRSNSPALSLPQIGPPPTISTDSSIFKVPLASPPILPKQHQQFKTPQLVQKSVDSSIFGGNQFAEPMAKLQSSSLTNFKFDAPQNTSSASNIAGSVFDAPAKDNGNSVFKIPFAAAKPATTIASGLGNSIFGGDAFKQPQLPSAAGVFLFEDAKNRVKSDNIFGNVAKSTAIIFQQTNTPNPEPMPKDSVFQHFNTQPVLPNFVEPHLEVKEESKTIFGAAAFPQLSSALPQAETAKRIAEAELCQQKEFERQRELEKEQEAAKIRREEAERKHQEALKLLQQHAERVSADELESVLATQVAVIAQSELSKYQKLQRDCEGIAEALLDQSIAMQLEELANEEYAMMCHDQLILNRYFERWLRYTRKKKKQRALMESTPVWVTMDTRAEQTAKIRHPNQSETLQMIKRYRHGEPCNFQLLLWKHPDTPSPPFQCIDIFAVVRAHIARKSIVKCGHMQSIKYFKLVLTLPNDHDELPGFESLCNKWLRKHVKRINNGNTSEVDDTYNRSPYICAMERDVALCVRKVSGIPPLTERGNTVCNECDNADAIICLMGCDSIQNTRKRMHHLIKLSRLNKAVPVAFIVYDGQYTDELELSDILEMETLVDEGKISGYKFFGCQQSKNAFSFVQHMGRALRYVVRESSFCNQSTEALEMQKLQSFLEACLGEELWQRWQQSSEQNPCFAKICAIPQHLTELYNEAVKRVMQITAEDFADAAELAEELREFVPKLEVDIPLGFEYFPKDWKSAQRRHQISIFLQRLLLAPIEEAPQFHEVDDWELWLLNYASRCIPNDEEIATAASYQSIRALIEQLNRSDLAHLDVVARFQVINYLPVMKAIAYAQINAVLKDYIEKSNTNDYKLPNEIIYHRQALEDYQLVPWWLNNVAVKAVKIDYSAIEEQDTSLQDKELEDEEAAMNCKMLDEIIKQAEEVSRKAEENFYSLKKQTISADTAELARDLDASIYQFELSKQIGCYDASFVSKASEINTDLEGAVGGAIAMNNRSGGGDGFSKTPTSRKRKHIGGAHGEVNEMEAVMTRAFNVIEKAEAKQDRAERLCKMAMLELE